MKQSKTTIKELTAAYRAVLRHGILCNAIAFGLIAAIPARAETITERQVVENGVVLDLSDIGASNIDSAGLYGGVYFIDNGNVTINGGNFDGNSAATSGAIESRRGTLTINNSTFSGNHATTSSGAIETWTDSSGPSNKLIINNSEFVDNYAPTFGTLSVFGMAGINEINNSHFITNHANSTLEGSDGDHDLGDGGAVFLGSKARLKITGTEFIGNTATSEGGALSTRSELQDNSASGLEIESSTFTANTAAKNGGALYLNIAHNTTLSGEASIKDSTFTMNTSTNGGAIYNDAEDGAGNMARVSIADTNFVGNVALGKGGAIYNKGEMFIEALHSDVEFYDNMAGGAANDIYNENLLWLTANTGQTISFADGIDGHNGTIIMLGGGLIDVSNALDNQTVTVSNGTLLHLSDPMTLNNSTIDVVDSAMLNTLDNTINADYNSHITLGNGTFVMFDADATGIDTFNIASGDQVTVGSFNMLSDIDSASVVRNLATAGNISVAPNMNAYTTASQYTLTGNSANSGQVTITKSGVGGLNAVAGNTTAGNHEVVNYAVTANDASVSSADVTIQNAEVMLVGAGTDSGAVGVTLGKKINVDGDSSLEILNAKFNGDGSIETTGGDLSIHASSMDVDITNGTDGVAVIIGSELAAGNTLENNGAMYVMDSRIASNVNNFFEYHSDPTYYEAQFVNEGHAWFDGDIFESTASLINNGMVDLNSVEFRQGSTINGTGTLYIGGTTIFDGVVSNNSLEIGSGTNLVIGEHGSINGADNVTLTAFGGDLNLNNGKIDTLGDVVANADLGLSVDANLSGGGAIDSVAALTGTGKLIVNSINLTSSLYADSGESVTLTLANTGNIELGENLTVTGGMNYYTDVHTDGEGNIVFSDKLINRSALTDTLTDYAALASDNVFTGENTFKNTNGINIANTDASIGANLKAAAYDESYNALFVTGVDGVIAQSFAATDGGFMTDHFSADDAAIELKNSSNETVFLADNTGALAVAGLATLGGLKLGDVTVTGIDTTVGAHADKLITSGAVNTALSGKQDALTAGNGIILSGAGNSVVSVKSGDGTIVVGADGVKVGTIGTANIANGAVTTDQIANGTITFADLNSDMVSSTSTMNVAAPSDEKLVTEAAVVAGINALVSEKETWVNNTLGITASEPNAVNTEYTGTNYLAAETTLTGADKALDSALKNTNDTIGAGEIGAGTAGTLTGQTIGSGTGNTTVTAALSTLNATNVAQNASLNTMAGLINGGTVDSATGVLTGGTALAAGTNGSNLVAATNTLSSLVNHNGTDAIIHRDFQTENMTVDASKSIVENINVISAELQNAESRVKVLEDNMIGADTSATFTNKTIDADANTITNLEVDNFKDGVVSQSIGTTGSENKLASEKAVRDAINERTTMGSTAGTNYGANVTVAGAIQAIDQNMGKIDGLVTAQTATTTSSGAAYNGNLAHGSATVEQHLSALDASVGDMRDFASDNNYATDTESVANNITLLDTQAKSNADSIATLNGGESTEGSVRNIAKGYFDLAAQSDALTLSAANAYTDKRIEKLDRDLSAGIASAVALSSVAVSDVRRGELSVGAGYGYFNGQSAGAFGAAMGISNRWSVNAGAGISGYDVSFRAGTNYKFKVF